MKELQEILKMSEPTVRKLIQEKKIIKLDADNS
jgi:DNA-binding CsgD family transcriptional regulator